MPEPRPFLTAEWRWLAMLNYEIDPGLVEPLVPPRTELDSFQGVTYVSVVGFLFLQTRVLGIGIPFHRNFEEVNLRFYVRRKSNGEWRRGVVFVRELVPRRLIAWVARTVYHEPYLAVPMSHRLDQDADSLRCCYAWDRMGQRESVEAHADGRKHPRRTKNPRKRLSPNIIGATPAMPGKPTSTRSSMRDGACGARSRPGSTRTSAPSTGNVS